MLGREDQGSGSRWLTAAVVAFGAAALALLLIAIAGGDLGDAWDDILPLAFAVSALLAFAGWSRDRRARGLRAVRAERRAEQAERQLNEHEREYGRLRDEARERGEKLARLEPAVRKKDEALGQERRARLRAERGRQAEKEWARELRGQVMRLYNQRGALGDADSLPELVLQTCIQLVGADKGLLLERADRDRDGRLDLVAQAGFQGDPDHSDVARRFAGKVMERDEILREDRESRLQGEGAKADDEISSLIAIPIFITNDFHGIVVCANRPEGFEELDDDVLLALGDHAGVALENKRLHGELRGSYLATVRMLADTIEAKAPDVRLHSDDVARYVAAVADELKLEPQQRERLIFASLLHDVGKIGISERILLKPGELTDEERGLVELHPRIGCRLIEQVPALRPMTTAVLHHHERYDGGGYPSGLKGTEIPLEARIVSVVDCFCAMTSDRPYKRGMSVEEACVELERCAGTQFDPQIVRLFVNEVRKDPPRDESRQPLASAFEDPEIQSHRNGGEPVLGYGTEVTDSLTLLYSHRHLHELAAAHADRAQLQDAGFAVVMVSIDDLEDANLSHGFAAGDDALRAAGRVMQAAAARCDGTPCRYSGRRLALLMPRAGEQQAQRMAADLTSQLQAQGRRVRTSLAVWERGDSGGEVLGRCRLGLELRPAGAA